MKNVLSLRIIFLLISTLSLASCERDYENEIISRTPPGLEVVVKSAQGTVIQNASVSLFKDEAAWTAETGAVSTKQTGTAGNALFGSEELTQPGFYYLVTTNGTAKVKTKTKYLLLNDGVTRVNIVLM